MDFVIKAVNQSLRLFISSSYISWERAFITDCSSKVCDFIGLAINFVIEEFEAIILSLCLNLRLVRLIIELLIEDKHS